MRYTQYQCFICIYLHTIKKLEGYLIPRRLKVLQRRLFLLDG